MNKRSCRTLRQRGVAAVEFALVAPMLFALLGGICYFGLAIYGKIIVTNYASAAVRSAVLNQLGGSQPSEIESQALANFTTMIGNKLDFFCNGTTPTASIPQPGFKLGTGQLNAQVYLLQMTVSCTANISSVVNLTGGTVKGLLPLAITTAMPFTINQPSN